MMEKTKTKTMLSCDTTAACIHSFIHSCVRERYLNIQGERNLLDACRRCFSSLFTNRAISYRQERGFDHFQARL